MPLQKIEKSIMWIHQNLPSQIAGVSASVVHKTQTAESVMNINKDVETVLVACVSALAVFIVRTACAHVWNKIKKK